MPLRWEIPPIPVERTIVEYIQTDREGRLKFAAISRTALGTKGARPLELGRFYARLPALGVTHVFHLGGVNRGVIVDLAAVYPLVPGITTIESYGVASAGRIRAGGRSDWDTTPQRLPIVHGASDALLGHLLLCYDPTGRNAAMSAAGGCSCRVAGDPLPEIILVGGQREDQVRQLARGSCAISVGVFDARPRYKNPPDLFGGTIVAALFSDTGELVEYSATFRDMSGGEKDIKVMSQ